MAKFNLEEYDTVESRIKKFYADHRDGRIITEHVVFNNSEAGFKAYIYKSIEDQKDNCAWATGYAYEQRDIAKQVNQYGKEYESVNYSSWTENAETSAIGRALANAGYMGSKRASRQEMEKVGRMNTLQAPRIPLKQSEVLKVGKDGISESKTVLGQTRACEECEGEMVYREGFNKQGKPYKGYFCGGCKNVEWVSTKGEDTDMYGNSSYFDTLK